VRGGKIASMQAFFDARPFAAMFEQDDGRTALNDFVMQPEAEG
jgi:hypothetical protein